MQRQYAQYMGLAIVVVGVIGFLLGEEPLLQWINIDAMEDVIHLLTGGIMAYVGYASRDEDLVKNVVGGVGVVYLSAGMVGLVAPTLFGMLPHGYSAFDNLLHLTLGILGISIAWAVGRPVMRSMSRN